MNSADAWPPKAIQFFISSSGLAMARLASRRFFISSTRWSLSGETSGRPRNWRASSGVRSISTFSFMARAPFGARLHVMGEPSRPGKRLEHARGRAAPSVIGGEAGMGEQVTIRTPDGEFDAYLAKPAAAKAPAIVVIQEIFGVNKVM